MTERLPENVSLFKNDFNKKKVSDPRTTRGCDFTWFNTSGESIVKTDYNNCTGDITKHNLPWGKMNEVSHTSFELYPWNKETKKGCDFLQSLSLPSTIPVNYKCVVQNCSCNNK